MATELLMNTSKIDALAEAAEERAELHNEGTDTSESSVSVERTDNASAPQPTMSFGDKLDAVLAVNDYSSIVSWLPSGKSFAIMDKEKFIREVLPRFFKETKFESFHRRLKRWGFRTAYKTSTYGTRQVVYTHDLFIKNRPELRKMMSGSAGNNAQVRGHHMQPAMILHSQRQYGHPAHLPLWTHQQMRRIHHSQPNYTTYLVDTMHRLSELDGEIFELEEQLKMLYRLKALKAKRRSF